MNHSQHTASSSTIPSPVSTNSNSFAKLETLRINRAELAAEIKSLHLELHHLATQGHIPSNNRQAHDASCRISQRAELMQQILDMESSELSLLRRAVVLGEQSSVAILLAKTKQEERRQLAQAKECARKGEIATARLFAQQVVRTRRDLTRLFVMDGTERLKGVDMLIEDVDERLAHASSFPQTGVESARALYTCSVELASDNLRLLWCEAELRRQAAVLVQEGQAEASRVLSKGIVNLIAARKRLGESVNRLVENARGEDVKEGIRCVHTASQG